MISGFLGSGCRCSTCQGHRICLSSQWWGLMIDIRIEELVVVSFRDSTFRIRKRLIKARRRVKSWVWLCICWEIIWESWRIIVWRSESGDATTAGVWLFDSCSNLTGLERPVKVVVTWIGTDGMGARSVTCWDWWRVGLYSEFRIWEFGFVWRLVVLWAVVVGDCFGGILRKMGVSWARDVARSRSFWLPWSWWRTMILRFRGVYILFWALRSLVKDFSILFLFCFSVMIFIAVSGDKREG